MGLCTKTPAESDLFNLDFSDRLEEGETLSGIVSFAADTPTGAAALTITGATWSGTAAQARIAGGTAGRRYHVTARVTTSAGNTLEDCGDLDVLAC